MPRVAVVVAAAGLGARMNARVRKPYLELAGRPILLRTLDRFAEIGDVREIVVAAHPDDVQFVRGRWAADLKRLKVSCVCPGGPRRQDSVYNALLRVSPDCELALVHDAARPLVRAEVIRRVIDIAAQTGAAIAAVRAKATVKQVDAQGRVVATPRRDRLWLAQTPQGFARGLLLRALEYARSLGVDVTDDAQAVELLGSPVTVVEGDDANLKITTPADLAAAEALWRAALYIADT